jgi:uncharacterized membrane protein YgdD (TMEM256/DUF423 family)
MPFDRLFLAIAAILGGTAVAAGAFASHALRDQLSERMLGVFETGVRYQMYHALALVLVALLLQRAAAAAAVTGWLVATGWCFVAGVLIFSGSLYSLSLTQIKVLGAVAPLGGVALMVGWGCLALSVLTGPKPG